MKHIYLCLFILFLSSCKESDRDRITRLIKEWEGKEIIFPENIVFTEYGIDTISYEMPKSDFTIISYIDSIGCTSCKLQLYRWKTIMAEIDSISGKSIPFLCVFHPKGEKGLSELSYLMKRDQFNYPVWIDQDDEYNKTNKLPEKSMFHSMLVDRQKKVIAMGDPFQNPQIKELYLKMICGGMGHNTQSENVTTISVEKSIIDFGSFDWETSQKAILKLHNTGDSCLVIYDIVTSCGCISLDYIKAPVESNGEVQIKITFKAEKPEFFSKNLTIYANTEKPLELVVKGYAN